MIKETDSVLPTHHLATPQTQNPPPRLLRLKSTDLSHYLLETLVEDREFLEAQDIREIEVMVSSGPGQTGSSYYEVSPAE